MRYLYRASTPTQLFTVPCEFVHLMDMVVDLRITYVQEGVTIIEKTISDVAIDGRELKIKMTQEETKKFNNGVAETQIRLLLNNGESIPSTIDYFYVKNDSYRIL